MAANDIWSIGIYTGPSPLQLSPAQAARNPVLTADHVTDVPAEFVADPFMLRVNGIWHMFFEVMNMSNKRGEIGLATSQDGYQWEYKQIVLRQPFHLSYPYVFETAYGIFMVPETLKARNINLYRADVFPFKWCPVGVMVPGAHADPSICFHNGNWWLFAAPAPFHQATLSLYYSEQLLGDWKSHANNPIVTGNKQIARPGGRVIPYDGALIRFTQDCTPTYGRQVRAFRIDELTHTSYKDHELSQSPICTPSGRGWNRSGMHHVDPHFIDGLGWLACVDGRI